MEKIIDLFLTASHSALLRLVVALVIIDTIFGCMRACKEHKWNSSVGINGALRKIGMLVSLVALVVLDYIIGINMIAFVPEEVKQFLGFGKIGLAEFFALLYIAYESVSVLKNMYLSGLPVKAVWVRVYAFLSKYTDELPNTSTDDKKPQEEPQSEPEEEVSDDGLETVPTDEP